MVLAPDLILTLSISSFNKKTKIFCFILEKVNRNQYYGHELLENISGSYQSKQYNSKLI